MNGLKRYSTPAFTTLHSLHSTVFSLDIRLFSVSISTLISVTVPTSSLIQKIECCCGMALG